MKTKFRIWDTSQKKMVYLDFNQSTDICISRLRVALFLEYPIMQFSGISDRNMKEIYEGDLVSAAIYSDEKPSILEVRFESGCFIIDYKDSESDFIPIGWFVGELKIIGNIYENNIR